jgi:hypothetical protein
VFCATASGSNVTVGSDATIKVTDECAAKSEGCKVTISSINCPTQEPQPLNFKFSGSGKLSEDTTTADLQITAKVLGIKVLNKKLSACGSQTIDLPAGAGTITLDLLACPATAGSTQSITGSVAATDSLPAGSLDITITATDPSGAKMIDLTVVVKKAKEPQEPKPIKMTNTTIVGQNCGNPGDCGHTYQLCCFAQKMKGPECNCHLQDGGSGLAGSSCGPCGAAYVPCCLGFKAKGFPCTCDVEPSV